MDQSESRSFGVFKPVGHVLISFPTKAQADDAAAALAALGVQGDMVRRYTDQEMLTQIDHDLQQASPLASIGQELNLIKAHRKLAEQGYHWLLVQAGDDEQAAVITACARTYGAERAQHYGRFIVEELIEYGNDLPQVAESPDRGLDSKPVTDPQPESPLLAGQRLP